jgi:hypothetical protein
VAAASDHTDVDPLLGTLPTSILLAEAKSAPTSVSAAAPMIARLKRREAMHSIHRSGQLGSEGAAKTLSRSPLSLGGLIDRVPLVSPNTLALGQGLVGLMR